MAIHPHEIRTPLTDETRATFRRALRALSAGGVRFSLGGALAVEWYSGVWRMLKDLDVYVEPENAAAAVAALGQVGFQTIVKHPEWLAQAFAGESKVDVVFGMGNWLAAVDAAWIDAGHEAEVLGEPVRVAPVEELIWSKAFIASRERNDAADIYHLIVAVDGELDWRHLLSRFEEHWELLLAHVVTFGYVYPGNRRYIPDWLVEQLTGRLERVRQVPWNNGRLCRGAFLDGAGAYALDFQEFGFRDGRADAWKRRARSGNFPPLARERAVEAE